MKRAVVLLFLLLLMPAALAFEIDIDPLNDTSNTIYFDETARYVMTISNFEDESNVYTWSVNPLEWIVESATSGKINPESSKEFELAIRPRPSNYRGPGTYILPVTIETADETKQSQLTVRVKSIEERLLNYNPSVALGASLDTEVDPREQVSMQIQIRNRNNRQIDNVTLELASDHFYKSETFNLRGLEEFTREHRFTVDPLIEPGTYEFVGKLVFEGETISQVERFYDVEAYSVIERDTTAQKSFLKSVQITQLKNDGNIDKTVSTNLKIPVFKRIFTSIELEANNIELQTRRSWVINLGPQETATVYVTQNYIPLLVLLVIIAGIIIAYFVMRSPIVLKKQIIVTGKDEEGISEMKVRIYIQNRTDNAYYNLRLLDKAPTIATVKESDGLGVLEPTKIIRTEKKGTIIKWDFDSLEAYEERIVTYTIKSKLKIIGNLNLPRVRIKYESAKGAERTTESGIAQIGTKK